MCIYSDGMGRTGVFITVMSEIERIKFDGEIDIFQTIKAIRVQRPNMVSTGVSVCVRLQIALIIIPWSKCLSYLTLLL